MTRTFFIAAFAIFYWSAGPASAINKCLSGGKISYSETACADQQIGTLATLAAPSPRDVAAAETRAARQKSQADQLESTRLRQEQRLDAQQNKQARANASHQKKCASLQQRQKWAEEDAATASGKSIAKKQRRAHRASEKTLLECGKA